MISLPKMIPGDTLLSRNGLFPGPDGGDGIGSPSGTQMNRAIPWESLFSNKNMRNKTRSWRLPDTETRIFTNMLLWMFPKPHVFSFISYKNCSQGDNPLGHGDTRSSQNDSKNILVFGNMLIKMNVKTLGSASEQCPNPVLFTGFHVAKSTLI